MSKFVLINDVHLSDRAPGSCTDTYLDDLFDLLHQVCDLVRDLRAAVILAGDVFHHKTPSRTSHSTVMRLVRWADECPGPVYAVAGNHDLSHDRLDSLHESQPLGVVFASGAIKNLHGWIDCGEFVYGVPWLMTWDQANVELALADYRRAVPEVAPSLVVTHAPLYPPGRELKFEYFPTKDFAAAMYAPLADSKTVHYGHVHEPHGVYQVGDVTFSNCGALSRGSLNEHNLTRMPSVAIWDSVTGEITHHELKAKPASEVFRLQEAREAKRQALDLSSFLDTVQATSLDMSSMDAVLAHVRATHTDRALIAVIDKLLQDAG